MTPAKIKYFEKVDDDVSFEKMKVLNIFVDKFPSVSGFKDADPLHCYNLSILSYSIFSSEKEKTTTRKKFR